MTTSAAAILTTVPRKLATSQYCQTTFWPSADGVPGMRYAATPAVSASQNKLIPSTRMSSDTTLCNPTPSTTVPIQPTSAPPEVIFVSSAVSNCRDVVLTVYYTRPAYLHLSFGAETVRRRRSSLSIHSPSDSNTRCET
ncbi:MAG: hypothetical protein J07HX64_01068 [halophilic archaeon J07HX64]|nr:MAG: hypothetical protein J07HX64_01068 [halophilic archaeon J07HX64]